MLSDQYDIYVSYAPRDYARVKRIVEELEWVGLKVWFERQPENSHESLAMLEQVLDHTKVHLVVWSKESAASGRVQAEARAGSGKGRLIATRIDHVLPPRGTQSVTYADLTDWNGGQEHRGMKKLLHGIYHLIGKGVKPEVPPPDPAQRSGQFEGDVKQLNQNEKDDRAWQICLAHNTKTYYQHYINHFPNGKYVQEARERLEKKRRNGNIILTCAIIWIIVQIIVTIAIQSSGY